MDIELIQGVLFNIVNDIVADHGVFLGAELRVDGGEALPWAVVMDQQVVDSQNFFMG